MFNRGKNPDLAARIARLHKNTIMRAILYEKPYQTIILRILTFRRLSPPVLTCYVVPNTANQILVPGTSDLAVGTESVLISIPVPVAGQIKKIGIFIES